MTDWRALCKELADDLETWASDYLPDYSETLVVRARAALAEPVAEGPTDEELLELWHGSDWYNEGATLREFRSIARAVLARWGSGQGILDNSAPAPADEVAELVAWLKDEADQYDCIGQAPKVSRKLRCAADLLEQRHPMPVPVAERLPGPGDCDAKGRCWWLHVGQDGVGDWFQRTPYPSVTSYTFFRMTHWLPATALPLPQGEVAP